MIPPPRTRDSRNFDPRISGDTGDGAALPRAEPDTYYGLPVIKAAPWRWYVPAYFYLGGVAGAAATLATAAELARDPHLARRLRWIASLGEASGAVCLIADLGMPARFHHMMRVFRPTSPMNIGTWILSAASVSGGLALLDDLRGQRNRRDRHRRQGPAATSAISALTGAMLATYTAVLLGNTAVPIWDATRRVLPPWFAATSAASLASLLELLGAAPRPVRRYAVAAKAGELVAAHTVARAAAAARVDRPLREGLSGRLWRGARWLGIAGLAATLLHRPRLAGALGTAAAVIGRFAIVEAGRSSAGDPRATFEPQRRGAGQPHSDKRLP